MRATSKLMTQYTKESTKLYVAFRDSWLSTWKTVPITLENFKGTQEEFLLRCVEVMEGVATLYDKKYHFSIDEKWVSTARNFYENFFTGEQK